MSALKTIERGYDLLIRILTVIITLALLVGACVVTINWLRATATAPVAKTLEMPKVSASDLVTHVVTPDASVGISSSNPDYASYERVRKAVAEFAEKHKVEDDDVGMDDVLNKVKSSADGEETTELTHAYVSGVADALEHTLADPKIDTLLAKAAKAQENSDDSSDSDTTKPMDVVSSILAGFDTEFDRQATAGTDGKSQKDLEKVKLDSWTTLAQIGVPLGLLVLLLQLLTFGKLAQSLGARRRGTQGQA
ncbi:MAG: hypothetical protein WAM90_00690 [Rhodanobacter sp.]